MPNIHFREKPHPGRPSLNRAHGLCRGLQFACSPGYTWGFTASTFQADIEDLRRQRGVFNTTVPNASPWSGGLFPGGRGFDNGDGSFNSVPEWLTGVTGDTRFDITCDFSMAVLIRADVLITDVSIPFFKHRNQPYGATEPGWMFSGGAANAYRFEFSSGAAEASFVTTTTQDLVRGHFLVVTGKRNGANTDLKFYVNGVLEASSSPAVLMGNPANTPIKFLGLGTVAAGQPTWPGQVSMGAVWNRVLSNAEITRMAGDPFIMWRPDDEFEPLGGLPIDVVLYGTKRWSMKMPRPVPRRNLSLWRGCKHATAPHFNGFEADSSLGEYDFVSGTRAPYQGNPPDATGFIVDQWGRGIRDSAANAVLKWPNTVNRYDTNTVGFSAAVLVKPRSLQSDHTIPIYKRRASPYNISDIGWNFTSEAGNLWRFALSDGTTELSVSSALPMDTSKTSLLLVTFEAAGFLSGTLRLYVDGVLNDEASGVVGSFSAAAGQTQNLLGVGPASAEFAGSIGMAAQWDRPLTIGEVSKLASDPFIMWRPEDEAEAFGAFLVSRQTYFNVF